MAGLTPTALCSAVESVLGQVPSLPCAVSASPLEPTNAELVEVPSGEYLMQLVGVGATVGPVVVADVGLDRPKGDGGCRGRFRETHADGRDDRESDQPQGHGQDGHGSPTHTRRPRSRHTSLPQPAPGSVKGNTTASGCPSPEPGEPNRPGLVDIGWLGGRTSTIVTQGGPHRPRPSPPLACEPLSWHFCGVLRGLRRRRAETSQAVCKCGNPLYLRVVGVAQRSGGEPVTAVSCLHCERCGDVKGQ